MQETIINFLTEINILLFFVNVRWYSFDLEASPRVLHNYLIVCIIVTSSLPGIIFIISEGLDLSHM